jgi:hypothetical protein
MKTLFSVLLVLVGLNASVAQSDRAFEEVAQNLLILVTDTGQLPRLEYIRIKTYRDLADQQDWTHNQKEEYKYDIEAKYGLEYELFHKKLGLLVDRYYKEANDGAIAEYLSSSYKEINGFKSSYAAEMRFIYKYNGMQSIVTFKYELFYNGRGLGFFGPPIIEEY